MKYFLFFFGMFLVIWLMTLGIEENIKWIYWAGCGLAGLLCAIAETVFNPKNK